MATSPNTIKNWFRTGLKPTQAQFWAWVDSFRHKDEPVPVADISGLQKLLDTKVDKKELVQPDQVGPYDPLKAYVFDAAVAEYVSYANPQSANPQYQVEGFYRLKENAPAGENPETHPAHWVYQGTVLGDIAIEDVVGLREELDGLVPEAPLDDNAYVRKNSQWQVLPEQSSGLASTWEANAAAIRAIANHKTGIDVGNYQTGIIYQYDDFSMDDDNGSSVLIPNNVPPSEPGRWLQCIKVSVDGHKHNAIDIMMADGTTAEAAINETRRQAIPFSTSIPFTSILTSMPKTNVGSELTFVANTAKAVAGARCVVVLQASGNTAYVPAFQSPFKESPESHRWNNISGTLNTIEFWFDGTTYWYRIVRDASDVVFAKDVIVKGGSSGQFTPSHDNDPMPFKFTREYVDQRIANYYPGIPSPDGENLGWYGVEWDEGRVTSGCIRTGALSGYLGGGAYGENGYGINTRPLSNIPENLLFVHNKIRRVMLLDNGTESYQLDPVDGYNKLGVAPNLFATVVSSTNTSITVSLPVFTADHVGRFLHCTTNGKRERYVMIKAVTSSTTVTVEDPRNNTTTALFVAGDELELCTAKFDGTDGQAVVRIPKIYYFHTYETSTVSASKYKVKVGVSLYPYEGFALHPAFIDGAGQEKQCIYMACFEGSFVGGKMASLPCLNADHSKTFPTFRQLAQSRGEGWQLEMFWYRSLMQLLFYVEYADLNSDHRIPGYCYGSNNGTWKRKTGRTLSAGNYSTSVVASEWFDADIVNSTLWLDNKVVAMSYRGIENLWGHMWHCLDGFNTYNFNVFATNNKAALACDTSAGYNDLGVQLAGSGYFNGLHAVNGAVIPKSVGGGSVYNYCDGVWRGDGWRVAFSGGNLYNGGAAGIAYLYANIDSTYASWYFGGRLCF